MKGPAQNTPSGNATWKELFSRRYIIYTFILNLGMFLFAVNQFVVATILPSVVKDLGGLDYYTWAFSFFAVGAIVGAASAGPTSATRTAGTKPSGGRLGPG